VAIYQTYDYQSFVDSFKDFLSNNKFDEIIIVADQFFRNIIINDRSVLDKIDVKVFDYTQNAISEIQACRS
jgi:hypothetical protein